MPTTYEELLQDFIPRPISSDRAYKRAMMQVGRLMRKPKKTRAEDDMLELLATLAEQYEIRQGHTDPVLSPRDRLAGLLEARGMTQTELSRHAKVPRTTINEILCGKRGISKANAVRMARFLGVAVEEFIAEER